MTTLRDLEAFFIKRGTHEGRECHLILGDQRGDAEGVQFLCPECCRRLGGKAGAHSIICWFTGVPLTVDPKPGRWNPQGSSIDDLTFVGPGSTSVLLNGGCNWHGHVQGGVVTTC